jgi:opacity protein-like surface antigen
MKKLLLAVTVFALLGLAAVASAQTLKNPSVATFTASVDHATVDKYTIGYFAPGATSPVQTADLGKPTPDATQTCTVTLNVMPLTFGAAYIAKVKAIAGTAESDWSAASNPFDRAPGPPSKPTVK